MNTPDYKKAKDKAIEILNEFQITEPVVPVGEIAERRGATIKYFRPDEGDLQKVSGFYDTKTKTIFVNSYDSPSRQIFTIAHELGHKELEHNSNEFNVLYRYATPIDKNPTEQEANCFATNLLVPTKILEKTMEKYNLTKNDTKTLAALFGVSYDVMKYKLQWMK